MLHKFVNNQDKCIICIILDSLSRISIGVSNINGYYNINHYYLSISQFVLVTLVNNTMFDLILIMNIFFKSKFLLYKPIYFVS